MSLRHFWCCAPRKTDFRSFGPQISEKMLYFSKTVVSDGKKSQKSTFTY